MNGEIVIRGARQNNLKGVTLRIPKNRLVVLTGLSGSGKSTLAFETLHREGQRQYMESLGLVTDHLSKPRVDALEGLSPSISVDQHLANRSPRSTVGTVTEVYTYLRVLFARLGRRPCPRCGVEVPPSSDLAQTEAWDEAEEGAPEDAPEGETYPCPACAAPVPELGMSHFSFNKPAGACPRCTGLGEVNDVDMERFLDPGLGVLAGGVRFWERYHNEKNSEVLQKAARHYGFTFDPATPIRDLDEVQRDLLLHGVDSPRFRSRFPGVKAPDSARNGYFEGAVTGLLRKYAECPPDSSSREIYEKFLVRQVCPDCRGERLRPESRGVTVAGRSIVELSRTPLTELAEWLQRLPESLAPSAAAIAEPVLADLHGRVRRLLDVGVGYLTMERSSPTLSAGEAQRLRLAALLGSGLTGVLYVLDEPTTGLHPRDNGLLIGVLRKLRDLGNTVLVIEHDPEMMRAADHLIDVGPGAGRHGGEIVAQGTPDEVAATVGSITGDFLSGRRRIEAPARRRADGRRLVVRGAREHNLKEVTAELPLGVLVAVTGVSGSGKSTLMFDVLDRAARQRFYGATDKPGAHDGIDGWEHLDRIITIDQSPIGRTPRSNAATYSDAFGAIRDAFAATGLARERGLPAKVFSFNVPGGRCERCQGAGVLAVGMHFLPDVQVRCPACRGRRFKPEVLEVRYRGRSIADVLEMSIEEALGVFSDEPQAAARLKLLDEVGLGYLQVGQPATTLSGGEAQRVKLAKELGRRGAGRTLYLLDEPTSGLHSADVARLLGVLQRLVDAGGSVVVIEHNLDVIRCADWILDLGPEGGAAGGRLLAAGTPEGVAAVAESRTGAALRARTQG